MMSIFSKEIDLSGEKCGGKRAEQKFWECSRVQNNEKSKPH
jgi:hypothetical protein